MQYPVFPWVINVYEGNHLDLNDVNTWTIHGKAAQQIVGENKPKAEWIILAKRLTSTQHKFKQIT